MLPGDFPGQIRAARCRLGFGTKNDHAARDRCFSYGAQARAAKRGAIVRTVRVSQYAAVEFCRLLYIYGFRQSMKDLGNCYDNAQAESFFSRFKAEVIEEGIFESIEEARLEIFSYIDGYYNRIRRHSGLGYKSPLEFEKKLRIENRGRRDSFLC